ncbi:MAG: hypothetical protein ABI647_23870 [Gemmatimonadota bacterium]
MWFKHRAWIPVAWLLSVTNLAAVWFAARPGEAWHATVHALLEAGLALGARYLMTRRGADAQSEQWQLALDQGEHSQQAMGEMQSRMQELEERLDFAERLLTKQRDGDRLDVPPR